jgi:hypothetical protein
MPRLIKSALLLIALLSVCVSAYGQNNEWWKMSDSKKSEVIVKQPSGPTRGEAALAAPPSESTNTKPITKADTLIRENATVFVDEMPDGFEHYLMSAMRKKSVPLIIVADPNQADYIIFGVSETKRAGWAKMLILGSGQSGEMASITMVNRKTKIVVFSDSSHRYNALRGRRSTAEKLAKYLGKKIKSDQKKLLT